VNEDLELTVRELASYFAGDVAERTIRWWANTGQVESRKDPRGRLVIRLGSALAVEAKMRRKSAEVGGRPRTAGRIPRCLT
jgi:hypothetical protein